MRRKLPRRGRGIKSPLQDPHALGLAAVAAELNLEINTLEPEVSRAVRKGAAALYLAGYGPASARARARRRRDDKGDRRREAGRVEAAPSGSVPTPSEPAISIQNAN